MMTTAFQLGDDRLDSAQLVRLASSPNPTVAVSDKAWQRLRAFRSIVDNVVSSERRVYGINTGFGYLAEVAIPTERLEQLQVNLIRSHACGVGDFVPDKIVRGLLLLRAHTFLLGHSGIREETVRTILTFLRHDVLPVVPCQGSVGASGDLAPLAHLAMGLMGEGQVRYEGKVEPAAKILEQLQIKPIQPAAKEGLSLINGTHFMTVLSAFALDEAQIICRSSDVTAALSLDAIRGSIRAFDERIQNVRGQPGQPVVAQNFRSFFANQDTIMDSHKDCGKVQDPYSFRCVPQVHGATRDVLKFVAQTVNQELNSVTDNPLVFEDGDVISGGNFHGQPLAMAMDFLKIAIAELGSISERRIEKITNPNLSGLPAFATRDSGLNSGFMIPHVVAAALVSENKILCHPASVDSIPTSADKEDHVSMGPIAARKALEVNCNVRRILAIETLAATQGIDLLAPLKPGAVLDHVFSHIRRLAPSMDIDRSLHIEIEQIATWLGESGIINCMEETGVKLN